MSLENITNKLGTAVAAADLSAKQFYAVTIDSDGKVALPTAQGQRTFGILQNDPESGKVAEVGFEGRSKYIAGGTIAAGDQLTTDSGGKLVTAYGSDRVVGIALRSAVVNDVADCILTGPAQPFAQHAPHSKSFHYNLADIADGDIGTEFVPGYAGRIGKFYAVATKAASTASKLTTLNLEIGTTNLTGGALALTSANMTPIGAKVDASAITAGNTFSATDAISIEASSTTAFAEGEVELVIEFF